MISADLCAPMHWLGTYKNRSGMLSDRLLSNSTVTELDTAREEAATAEG